MSKKYVDRREILRLVRAAAIVGLTTEVGAKVLKKSEATLPEFAPKSKVAGAIWVSPANCYFTYPHSNGFLPSGNPVVAQIGDDNRSLTYLEWDFRTGATRPIFQTTRNNMYWDIAKKTGELFAMNNRSQILSVPTSKDLRSQIALQINATPSARLEDLISVCASGRTLLYAIEKSNDDPRNIRAAELFELDLVTGLSTSMCAMPFDADHPQYCPHDERWIGFAHEGDISKSLDRVWAIDRTKQGKSPFRLWDDVLPNHQAGIVGHERWAFHRAGALVVAYPVSAGRPWGLYFVDALSRQANLISASDYDWHCNISHNGKWAVVDTGRPHLRPVEADGRAISDIVLIEMKTGARFWLARSHRDTNHPWHPHPHFSPDDRHVIYNDFERGGAGKASNTVIVELAIKNVHVV